jgi:hypothetical protein
MSQKTRTSLGKDLEGLDESDSSSEDFADLIFPAKRPNKSLEQAQTRKRRNATVTAERSETVVNGKR